MTRVLLFLISLFGLHAKAQNWLPIDTAKDYNFTLDQGNLIMRTISTTQSNDTTFFESIVDSSTANFYYSLQSPDFLGYYMVNDFDSVFTFYGNESFTIKAKASLGETWLFSAQASAEVIALEQRMFDTILDSVKLILINQLDTLILAKNMGIVHFYDPVRNKNYNQIGIEQIYGIQNLSFWDIYNFNVGDVFQYHTGYGHSDGPYLIEYEQRTILEKEIGIDYYQYKIFRQVRDNLAYPFPYFYTDTQTITYFQEEYLLGLNTGSWDSFEHFIYADPPFVITRFYSTDTLNQLVLSFDAQHRISSELINGCCLYVYQDTLGNASVGGFNLNIQYQSNLGKIFDEAMHFETTYIEKLIGYDKGNGPVGEFKPISFFTTNIELVEINQLLNIYPNPSSGKLQIELKSSPVQLTIFNTLGKHVLNKQITESTTLYLNEIPAGLYFMEACTLENACGVKKLIFN